MGAHNREVGNAGEDAAFELIQSRGFTTLERNYRSGRLGEIDIIATRDNLLVFFEVKSRNSTQFGGPLYSISRRKKNTLKLIANQYLCSHPGLYSADIECRFDMISILDGQAEWIEDIFR
ncbi:MAG: YraN family protein [Spirochaetes bacterium]|nr:MAG: YraN family protein [Spirochaetota bacterium]